MLIASLILLYLGAAILLGKHLEHQHRRHPRVG